MKVETLIGLLSELSADAEVVVECEIDHYFGHAVHDVTTRAGRVVIGLPISADSIDLPYDDE